MGYFCARQGGPAHLIPTPHVALAQHVLPLPAGTVGTHAGPFLSTAVSMRITVYGRGSHGSMPQLSVDPVVLAAMIVARLQAIVAIQRVVKGECAVSGSPKEPEAAASLAPHGGPVSVSLRV